jgi:hypothetical protein
VAISAIIVAIEKLSLANTKKTTVAIAEYTYSNANVAIEDISVATNLQKHWSTLIHL